MKITLTEEEQKDLKTVVDHFENEDKGTRDRQIRSWRKLKLLWDGFQRVWYSETAHDWRIYDEYQTDQNDQDNYNKPINVFRAYLETIIAALSVTVPGITCYPDDADNPLDIATAKAGDKIGELISRHNDVSMLWLHALYTYCTEGMVACYNYTDEDEKYGTYQEDKYQTVEEEHTIAKCPMCGNEVDKGIEAQKKDEYDPDGEEDLMEGTCLACLEKIDPELRKDKIKITKFVGKDTKPKSRQCMEVYGGLYVKIANYAKCQKDTPYLIFSYETNYTFAREWYKDIRDKIQPGMSSPTEPYARWGRNNPQYYGEMPTDNVTVRNAWLRPNAFEILEKDSCDRLKAKFKNGCKAVFIEQEFAEAVNESLDDHWTLTNNPLADYLYFDPIGLLLISIQEITNDLVSLTLQTIEHGIPQTFADPQVLNFKAYSQMETVPGAIYPATPKSGKNVAEGFYEVKTSTLSGEVLPFTNQVQSYGQLVSGALPSLAGGAIEGGSNTASEYSMSRAQALQRLGNTWKMFTIWWKTIYGKVIPAYIKTVKEDERIVQKDDFGNYVNVLIRKSELEGKIGNVEIEANENLPMSWAQRRDVILKLLEANNPQVLAMIAQPENLELIYEAVGITDFYVPGADDRSKQYDEIKQLLNSEPIAQPPDPMMEMQAATNGMPPPPPIEVPSVDVDPIIDNHAIEFAICQKWAISPAGQLAKIEKPNGYRNVLLHAVMHKQLMMEAMMQQQQEGAPLANPKQDKQAPITEDSNVAAQA